MGDSNSATTLEGAGQGEDGMETILTGREEKEKAKGAGDVVVVEEEDCYLGGEEESGKEENGGEGMEGEADCSPASLNRERMLVGEIERLRKALGEVSKRVTILEDFIQVEYADKFAKFLTNRDRLVGMGYGANETEEVEGQRSAKNLELVELLKVIKEQASATSRQQPKSASSPQPRHRGSPSTPSMSQKRDASPEPQSQNQPMRKRARRLKGDGTRRVCPLCQEIFWSRSLRDHLLSVHRQLKLACQVCRQEFPTKGGLREHLKCKHNLSDTKVQYYAEQAEGQVKPWLDSQVEKARKPSQEEVNKYRERVRMEHETKRAQKLS